MEETLEGGRGPPRDVAPLEKERERSLKQAIPDRIHVLPLLSRSSWTKFIFTNVCIKDVLCSVIERIM